MKIVCVTPIKNESWILDNFIKATSLWADHIILADQGSSDNSVDIAKKYKNVTVIKNPQKEFDEIQFRSLLLTEARKIPGDKIIFALDADEVLTPNFESAEWKTIKEARLGNWFAFPWFNIKPEFSSYWQSPYLLPFAFSDNDAQFKGTKIHGPRLPEPGNNPIIKSNNIQVLHLQYINWERMQSKHRWYMCYEVIENHKPWWQIYLEYHHMYAVDKSKIKPVPSDWIEGYKKKGIDITKYIKETEYWWDEEVINYFKKYGEKKFMMLDIWDKDWGVYKNPQNAAVKIFFRFLKLIYPPIYRLYVSLPSIKRSVLKAFDL